MDIAQKRPHEQGKIARIANSSSVTLYCQITIDLHEVMFLMSISEMLTCSQEFPNNSDKNHDVKLSQSKQIENCKEK